MPIPVVLKAKHTVNCGTGYVLLAFMLVVLGYVTYCCPIEMLCWESNFCSC